MATTFPPAELSPRDRIRRDHWLVGLEFTVGTLATIGGALLAIAPDGSWLMADVDDLNGSPFANWRLPGILLAVIVGGGFLATGWWQVRRGPYHAHLSVIAGFGLIVFETVELNWLGFQPLELRFAVIGVAVMTLAGQEAGRAARDQLALR